MSKLLSWLLLVPLAIVVIAFAIANRHAVELSLDPLPYRFDLPLFAVAYAGIIIGLCVGGFTAWARAGRWRRRARQERRLATQLSQDIETTRAGIGTKDGDSARSLTKVA